MSGNGGEEAPRPRPLSGGLWTLFSWLRRDERASSSDSLSSAGSDRTALSFSFLPPVKYTNGVTPLVVPPPGPPTDSYRKRVQDRNLRRQHDRNITLHRKYGLYRSDCPNGYDAFSLPPTRRIAADSNSKWDRERRATSECFQNRVVHVPGKRRAPLPPTRASSVGPATTLSRRNRKRPAPQPPVKHLQKIEEDNTYCNESKVTEMNSQTLENQDLTKKNDISMGCKSEKYSKKDINTKENKLKPEKSFLKQIFETKKRHSTIETSSVKVLPNISELDKQAAEIIKSNKQNSKDKDTKITRINLSNGLSKGEYWFCIICLRKYDSSIADCLYCAQKQRLSSSKSQVSGTTKNIPLKETASYTQTDNLSEKPSSSSKVDDKQKLKEMLKEMKDSLPKRPKNGVTELDRTRYKNNGSEVGDTNAHLLETPTLRIGTIVSEDTTIQPCKENQNLITKEESPDSKVKLPAANNVLITRQIAIEPSISKSNSHSTETPPQAFFKKNITVTKLPDKREDKLNTPLKISSLLNPIYIPKDSNHIVSNILPIGISRTEKNNTDPHVSGLENKNKPHTIFTTYTAVIPSAAQALQAQCNQENSKRNQGTPENVLNSASSNIINKISRSPSAHQEPIKGLTEDKNNLKNVDASGPDKLLPRTEKKEELLQNNNTSPSILLTAKQDDLLRTPITLNSGDKKNCKITHRTGLNPGTALLSIAEDIDTPESKMVYPEKKASYNVEAKIVTKKSIELTAAKSSKTDTKNHHLQRRALINQLEQSIAKGDERSAAEAAAKLAQLRLSCSVLSFSSQIMSEPTTSSDTSVVVENVNLNQSNSDTSPTQLEVKLFQMDKKDKTKLTSELSTPIFKKSAATAVESSKTSNQPSTSKQQNDLVSIKVWVEDRESARGPIHFRMQRQATMGNLRNEAEASLGLGRHLQRWIVGRTLCTDDNVPLESVAGVDFSAPIYLCLVESEVNKKKLQEQPQHSTETTAVDEKGEIGAEGVPNVYKELVQLEQQALVPNAEAFECGICMEESAPGSGAVLRDCIHTFCKQCLSGLVLHCEEPIISCPAMGCRGNLEEREIRALVTPEEYERWLVRGLNAAESGTRNAFHCRTRDCTGWALCEPGVRRFPCPVCKHTNCVPCQAIHEGQTCEEFNAKLKKVASNPGGGTDNDTQALLNTLIKRGEALECPECKAIITKKWGCDWIKCSACKTEICWVTRGRRWGPAGRGDTSAGCRCGVDGKRCHPSCGYCH